MGADTNAFERLHDTIIKTESSGFVASSSWWALLTGFSSSCGGSSRPSCGSSAETRSSPSRRPRAFTWSRVESHPQHLELRLQEVLHLDAQRPLQLEPFDVWRERKRERVSDGGGGARGHDSGRSSYRASQ